MLGAGRPAKRPNVQGHEGLTREEVLAYTPAKIEQNKVATFRDSHHRVARLFAFGMRPGEVASASGYSLARISTLYADPTFRELIAVYKRDVDVGFTEQVDEYYSTVNANRTMAARRLNDMLSDDAAEFTVSQLVAVHADAADRTGYPKRSVAVNVNTDFAALLDQARKRSAKVLEAKALPPPSQPEDGGRGAGSVKATSLHATALPTPLRRRA